MRHFSFKMNFIFVARLYQIINSLNRLFHISHILQRQLRMKYQFSVAHVWVLSDFIHSFISRWLQDSCKKLSKKLIHWTMEGVIRKNYYDAFIEIYFTTHIVKSNIGLNEISQYSSNQHTIEIKQLGMTSVIWNLRILVYHQP